MKKPSTAQLIAELLYHYENEPETTFGDLVDGIEDLAIETGDLDLSLAISKYRIEERYDREYLGMRGDMDAVEADFIEAVRLLAFGRTLNEDRNASAALDNRDYTLINSTREKGQTYPAVLINKVIGAREHELPLLEKAGYTLFNDAYLPPSAGKTAD
ncbi:MAG: hypothetical protein FJZ79_05060 [Chlorobi bacterium]|nr:hypothetical protein [Chlorobiota bacterium]